MPDKKKFAALRKAVVILPAGSIVNFDRRYGPYSSRKTRRSALQRPPNR
jgi:hypothetical protein